MITIFLYKEERKLMLMIYMSVILSHWDVMLNRGKYQISLNIHSCTDFLKHLL